jgi:hypothetical protein
MRIASQGVSLDGNNDDAKSTKSQKADEPVKTDEELAKEAAEQDPLWKYTKEV